MNLFKVVLENVILVSFPVLIYLIYLSTNKNIKSKDLYFKLVLLTSLYLVKCFGSNILVLNSIVILLYTNNYYIYSNVFGLLVLLAFMDISLVPIYIILLILYIIKRKINMSNSLFIVLSILLNVLIYGYMFRNTYGIITINISFIITTVLLCLMYIEGNKILKEYLEYKELKKEEQVRMSLFKITHEIKNPIAVCKGYLDMINMSDKKQVERFIPIIKSEIDRLLILLEDFLNINRQNNFDIMDINMLLEDIRGKLEPMIDSRIKIKTDLVDDEIYINGDYNRLNQMLLNIVKNSIEAIIGTGKILISSKMVNKDYVVTIEDTGIGMNKEVLNKMKEPFFTTKDKGTGLGLPLIYEIALSNGIKIEYKSKEKYGTQVILKFRRIEI